jgi:uncharacterized protein YjiS (DUF1127 family)
MLTNTSRLASGAPKIPRSLAIFIARLGRYINRLVAAAIARHERQAAIAALRCLGDRELKDIGLYRGQTADAVLDAAEPRNRMRRSQPF